MKVNIGRMMFHIWLIGIAAIFVTSRTPFVKTVTTLEEHEEEALYYLDGFKRSLENIFILQENQTTPIHYNRKLRSIKAEDAWKRLTGHILTFCEEIKDDVIVSSVIPIADDQGPEDAVVLSTRSLDAEMMATENASHTNWFVPEVRPIHAQAERAQEYVKVIFDVIHSGRAVVARIKSFQFARAELVSSFNDSGLFVSRVQFVTNASFCQNKSLEFIEQYEILMQTENGALETTSKIKVDICGFDKYKNMSLGINDRKWETRKGIITEDIVFPKFRIISGKGHNFFITPGRNEIFLVNVCLNGHTYLKAFADIYDYTRRTWYTYFILVTYNGLPYAPPMVFQRDISGSNVTVLSLEILRAAYFRTPALVKEEQMVGNINMTLRLTLITSNNLWTGKLSMDMSQSSPDYNIRSVVRSVRMDRVWMFKSPENYLPLPIKIPKVKAPNVLRCTLESKEVFPRSRPSCSVRCSANGPNITSISIYESDNPTFSPLQSVSYVLGDNAFSMVDLGSISNDNNQTKYLCTVDGILGRWKKEILLYIINTP